MKIQALHITNFKRFSDLTIKEIPEKTKLVVLIGANGSGKSSVFDAFEWFKTNKTAKDSPSNGNSEAYYKKDASKEMSVDIEFGHGLKVSKNSGRKTRNTKITALGDTAFFGRPSMRIVPRLVNDDFNEKAIQTNTDGPAHFIDFDTRFQSDVKKFTWDVNKALRDPLFLGNDTVNLKAIAQQFINPVNTSLMRIFGSDPATNIQIANYQEAGNTAAEPAKLIFSKGNSLINYDLLSHGEKQIITILLNFIIRTPFFQDTIYYIDEMDVHLNTTLQYALLEEITDNWIPENCQLWTATHALGFIEYAKDADHAAIIDFDNLDFDKRQELEPTPKYENEIFDIAVPRASLTRILGNRKIVLCENKNYQPYNLMGLDDFVFTDVDNSNAIFLKIKRDKTLIGLRDRDFLTDSEIQQLLKVFPNYKTLRYYCFENYLFHPDNIAEIALTGFDKDIYKKEITALKNEWAKGKIIPNLVAARNGYEEFKSGGIKKEDDLTALTLALESNDFETFYPYFNAKIYLAPLRHSYKMDKKEVESKLAQTMWFKEKIKTILM